MSIRWGTIAHEWIEFSGWASSSRKDALRDKCVSSLAKPVAIVKHTFKETAPSD